MPDQNIEFCGIRLKNPLILASGILGVNPGCLKRAEKEGAGAVTIKSISLEPRTGHNSPILVPFDSGMLNAVGYSNPGLEEASRAFTRHGIEIPVIASIIGQKPEEFSQIIERFEELDFCGYEIPVSCPHTPGFGTMGNQDSPDFIKSVMKVVTSKTKRPVIVKIPPLDKGLGDYGQMIEDCGADAINAINTAGPGMVIDIESRKPFLGFKKGGLSGPALKPIAVRCVYDLYKAVKIPIIGTGGITTGADAVEMFMAGASALGVGTAVYFRGMNAFSLIQDELAAWLSEHNLSNVNQIKGTAH